MNIDNYNQRFEYESLGQYLENINSILPTPSSPTLLSPNLQHHIPSLPLSSKKAKHKRIIQDDLQPKRNSIQKIYNDKLRQTTFLGRKNGLFRKAIELSVLCDVDISIILFSNEADDNQLYVYRSSLMPVDDLFVFYNKENPYHVQDNHHSSNHAGHKYRRHHDHITHYTNEDFEFLDNLKPGCIPKKKKNSSDIQSTYSNPLLDFGEKWP